MPSHNRNAHLFATVGFSKRTARFWVALLAAATLFFVAGIQRESVALTGGPDAFGYTFIDSTEPGGPAYNFEDISATGTPITLGDDATSGPIPLGFTFGYYGTNYTAVYVSSNGWIAVLAPGTSGLSPARMPTAAAPNAVIAGWWHDLDPPHGGSIRYQILGSAPNRRFIVQFTNIQHYPSGNPCTFQWKLFEGSNAIEIHYSAAPSDGAAHAVGIENQTGTVGLEYFYGTTALSTPLAVRFRPDDLNVAGADLASVGRQGGPFNPSFTTYTLTNQGTSSLDWKTSWTQPWIAATPSSGTLAAGTSTTVQVSLSAAANSLTSGTYTATVTFANLTSRIPQPRPVRLTVLDHLQVSPATGFSSIGAQSGPFVPSSTTYSLTNIGPAAVSWTTSKTAAWVDVTPPSGTLAPGASTMATVTLNANAYSLAIGNYPSTFMFKNTGSGQSTVRNALLAVLERLTIIPADPFVSAGTPGGPFVPASRTYTLTNTGLTPFNWVALETADWVDVTPWYGTLEPLTSATVAVSIAAPARTLAAGLYTTTVAFLDIDSGNALGRNVVLHVHGGPVVDLDTGFATSPLTRIYGDDPGDYLGSHIADGIAYGDVNGDGYDDLIIGANISHSYGGPRAGGVYVIYGSASLPARTIDLNTNGAISGTSETRILGDHPGDGAGSSVASGDVNGDGYDDVIIGVPYADPPGGVDAGEVYIIYGSPSLPGRIIDLNTSGAISAAGETRILGDDAGDRAGLAVASGDANGDGYDDVIIGAPDADPPGGAAAGEVYVIYGSATLSSSTIDLNTNGAISRWGETRILGDDAGDEAGWPVASGDVNGDGYDDIIIAVWAGDPPGGAGAGEVYVVYGSATLSSATLDLNTNGAISRWGETRILGDDAGDGFGWLVDAGDVNRDGYDDVIVGAPIANPPGGVGAGEVYVVYGSATLSSATLDLNTNGAISRWGETRILGDDAGDNAGFSVGCGDINGDGYDDVILGAPAADPPGGGGAGEVYVIHGSARLSSSTVDLNTTWGDLRVLGDNPNDQFGYSGEAGPGDLDRNGFADLTAAARYGDNPSIGGNNDSGYAAIVFGQGPATSATVTEHFKAGIAPKRGFGGRLSPVARTWLSFDGGTSAPATVTLYRSKTGIIHLGNGSLMDVANVVWQLTTPRTGFRSAEMTVQYTDSESPGGDLALYQAPALYGPWTRVTTQTLDTHRNTITATVTGFSYFALLGEQVPPNVTVNQAAGQRDPTGAFPIRFSVIFSENVVGFNAGDVTMGGTATGVVFNVTGSGSSYTIAVTGATGDGTIAPRIAAGVCQDLRGNFSNASTSTDNRVTLDRVRPTAVMISTASNPTNTSPILVTVTFSKPVTGFAASDVVTSNAVVRSFSGTGANYAVALAPTGPGLVTADIPATAAHDAAGNDNLAAAQFRRTFDNVRPAVALSSAVPDPTNLLFIAVTVVFSEPVTGFDASDLMVSNATVIGLWGSGSDYIVFLVPQAAGLITVNIAAGAAHDAAGNGNAPAIPFSRTFDNVPPRLTGLTVRNFMALQVALNEPVRNADQASNYSCTGGVRIVTATRQSDTQYLLNTTEQKPGTSYTLTVGNGVTDRAGNPIDANFRSWSFGGGARTAARPAWPLYR